MILGILLGLILAGLVAVFGRSIARAVAGCYLFLAMSTGRLLPYIIAALVLMFAAGFAIGRVAL